MTTTDISRPRSARMYLRGMATAEERGATEHRRRLLEGLRGSLLFELYADALGHPDRYRAFLSSVVEDWLAAGRELALRAGCPPDQAGAVATANLAQFRGLLLDLLTNADRALVDAAFELYIERRVDAY